MYYLDHLFYSALKSNHFQFKVWRVITDMSWADLLFDFFLLLFAWLSSPSSLSGELAGDRFRPADVSPADVPC